MSLQTYLTDSPTFGPLPPIDCSHVLTAFYQAAISTRLPVALWRYPGQADKQALVDLSGAAQPTKINFQRRAPGFAFAPFINEDGRSTLFLKAGLRLNQKGIQVYRDPNNPADHIWDLHRESFLNRFQELMAVDRPTWDWSAVPVTDEKHHIATQAEFCQLVAGAVQYIKSTGIKKVVASRATEVPLPRSRNPVAIFEKLCDRYPHAFVSLVSIPDVGTWIGASPEILLTLDGDALKTVALAGTQIRLADLPLEDVTWGAKEIEEQALVGDYIRHFFQQLNLANFIERDPRTVSAGNVVHLKTEFQVNMNQTGVLKLGNQILDTLHPTSAVCGMPKKEALSFILEKERYNRKFYSGFLGPVHLDGQSQLFVNLRCMQLASDRAILYVGAGITHDSVPQSEWQETVLKSQTLLAVLEEMS
jgi:isochorismate synthase